jgi:hypothetical protein
MLVLRHGLTVIGIGLVIGAAAALGLTRLIAGFLWGVTASDPQTYGAVLATITLVALFACLVPAYRAMKVDPADRNTERVRTIVNSESRIVNAGTGRSCYERWPGVLRAPSIVAASPLAIAIHDSRFA